MASISPYLSNPTEMMHTPKVSVIIPNFNHAQFLAERIESVLAQSFQDFELIYLDDMSEDESNQVFSAYSDDPRVSSIINDKNSGSTFKQWNKGIANAKGEYVWIAESDDSAESNFLETLVPILENNPKINLAYCQSLVTDEQSNHTGDYFFWTEDLDPKRWQKSFKNDGRNEIENYMVFKNTIPNASAVLLRKSAYLAVGGANESFTYCGDWLMWLKMLKVGSIYYHCNTLNRYRCAHPESVRGKTLNTRSATLEALKVLRWIKDEALSGHSAVRRAAGIRKMVWKTMIRQTSFSVGSDLQILTSLVSVAPSEGISALFWYLSELVRRLARRIHSLSA